MKARWALNYLEAPELPRIQQTLIAGWLPWNYCIVSTIRFNASSTLSKLTISQQENSSFNDVPSEKYGYMTIVDRCDKYGVVKRSNEMLYDKDRNFSPFIKSLFTREYSDMSEAITGHREAVLRYSKGCKIFGPGGQSIKSG